MFKKILVTSSYYILNNKILFQPMILRVHLIVFYVFFSHPSCQTSIQPSYLRPQKWDLQLHASFQLVTEMPNNLEEFLVQKAKKSMHMLGQLVLVPPMLKNTRCQIGSYFQGVKMCETKKRNHRLHNIPAGTFDDTETLETVYRIPKNQWNSKKNTCPSRHAKAENPVTVTFSGGLPFWGWSQAITLAIATGGASQRFP